MDTETSPIKTTSIITILHGEVEFIPLILNNFKNFKNKESLDLVVIDDGRENLISHFAGTERCIYIHLGGEEKSKFTEQIFTEYKEPNKSLLQYEKKRSALPNGFLRDYGCGMSDGDNIFHMNMDCIYSPKSIDRKLNFMSKVGAECIFCDKMLCYDIHGKELYKTESEFKIYEQTLFHTREFWKRRNFQWHDTVNEGKNFHYNNGIDHRMDNYYDTIQLLSIHNINKFNPIKVTLEGIDIEIPDIVKDISQPIHPVSKCINDLFPGPEKVTVLGLESVFLENIEIEKHWQIHNITEKWKQTKLSNICKQVASEFNVFLYCAKSPAWDLFKHVPFDIIMLETSKNYEQMASIILKNKVYEYIHVDGIFVRKEFLEQ